MSEIRDLLLAAAGLASEYLEGVDDRPVFPGESRQELRARLSAELPRDSSEPLEVLQEFAAAIDPALVSVAGGRYFGFVTGGSVPAALAADWLATAWDQNAFSYVSSPAAAIAEDIASGWILELLGLPSDSSVALVTGCQMAHVTALAAARHHVLNAVGWDVARQGMQGCPPVRIVAGQHRHVTVDRAARLLGFGTDAIEAVGCDDQGRIVLDDLAATIDPDERSGPLIVVAQAGEVNTGSFDSLPDVIEIAHGAGAWVHLDAAFGAWARASPRYSHLAEGMELVDSVAFDGHKWLNVPYDSGFAVVAHPASHRAAMGGDAAYLASSSAERDAIDWTPDASRRARGFAVYAALRSLGRTGICDIVERCCANAQRFSEGLAAIPGAELVNEVVLNQVLFRFAEDRETEAVLAEVQGRGVAWMGGTTWHGRSAIRLSVSSWATSEEDIDRTLAEIATAARLRSGRSN